MSVPNPLKKKLGKRWESCDNSSDSEQCALLILILICKYIYIYVCIQHSNNTNNVMAFDLLIPAMATVRLTGCRCYVYCSTKVIGR